MGSGGSNSIITNQDNNNDDNNGSSQQPTTVPLASASVKQNKEEEQQIMQTPKRQTRISFELHPSLLLEDALLEMEQLNEDDLLQGLEGELADDILVLEQLFGLMPIRANNSGTGEEDYPHPRRQ